MTIVTYEGLYRSLTQEQRQQCVTIVCPDGEYYSLVGVVIADANNDVVDAGQVLLVPDGVEI